ncbi:IS982 family transposase, partial [Lactobacillus crispatus]
MNCLKLKRFSHHLQVSFKDLVIICRHWYRLYAPAEFKQRTIEQIKTTDSLILALLIWQAKTGIESQRRFCECFNCLSHSNLD